VTLIRTMCVLCLTLAVAACGDTTDPGSSASRTDPVGIWNASISGLQGNDAGGQPATCTSSWVMAIEATAVEPVRTSMKIPGNASLQCGQDPPVREYGIEQGHRFLLLQSSDTLTFLSSFTATAFLVAHFTDSVTLTGQLEDPRYPGATFSATRRSDTVDPNRVPYSFEFYTEWQDLEVGDSVASILNAYDAYWDRIPNPPVTMSSDRPHIATVDAAGIVRGLAPGQVQLTAVLDTFVRVDNPVVLPPVASLEITTAPDFLVAPDSGEVQASAYNAAGDFLWSRRFHWTSSNPAVATVSEYGHTSIIASVAPGTVTITARSTTVTASVTLDVLPAVAGTAAR
jgi:Big-like domain-containing protein